MTPLSIAIIIPFGNDGGSYFSDTLEARMCEEAKLLGHRARLVRVTYDGTSAERDAEIGARLAAWLAEHDVDLVVTQRFFDPGPIVAHRRRAANRRVLLIAPGDLPSTLDGVDFVLGDGSARPSLPRREMIPSDQLLDVWVHTLDALVRGESVAAVAGVATVEGGRVVPGVPLGPPTRRRPFRATVACDSIAATAPRAVRHRTLQGTFGCPYSGDPMKTAHFDGVSLPTNGFVARLGCSFCPMGGDYIAGTDESIVRDLLEQATFWAENDPDVEEFVLSDQHPIRYLGRVMDGAGARGLRRMRWLFAARADAFIREAETLERAVRSALDAGQCLEVYLTGFESFSDVELARYNKGIDVAQQLKAIANMRALHVRHPSAFEYARSRGHSLILWNPWTEPSDLRATVDTVRENGLRDLLQDLGRNRLRIYPNLPIFHAAARDGLADAWDDAGDGTARGLGYAAEYPWRFRDERTRVAFALSVALRAKLGSESELAQLAAVTAFAESGASVGTPVDDVVDRVRGRVECLERALGDVRRAESTEASRRPSVRRASVVMFTGACNNGCSSCSNGDAWLDDGVEALEARVDRARESGFPIVLAGREPTLHVGFLKLVARARGADARLVAIVTNGRRFAYERFVAAATRAGLASASVKLFGPDPGTADAFTRAPDSHAQGVLGLSNLSRAGVVTQGRIVLHRDVLDRAHEIVDVAARAGASQLSLDVQLDAVTLDRLDDAALAVDRVARRAALLGLPLHVASLGHAGFEHVAVRTRA